MDFQVSKPQMTAYRAYPLLDATCSLIPTLRPKVGQGTQTLHELLVALPRSMPAPRSLRHNRTVDEMVNQVFYDHETFHRTNKVLGEASSRPLTKSEYEWIRRLTVSALKDIHMGSDIWFFNGCIEKINVIWIIKNTMVDESMKQLFYDAWKKTIQQVVREIHHQFVWLWSLVPRVKGTHAKTVVKQLFNGRNFPPFGEKPSEDKQKQFISYAIKEIDSWLKWEKTRNEAGKKIARRNLQRESRHTVENTEWKLANVMQINLQKQDAEEAKLERLKNQYEKQFLHLQQLQSKNQYKCSIIENNLNDSMNIRSATLLPGVCKSLNQHYSDIFDKRLTVNPFTNISSDTFLITTYLLEATKNH